MYFGSPPVLLLNMYKGRCRHTPACSFAAYRLPQLLRGGSGKANNPEGTQNPVSNDRPLIGILSQVFHTLSFTTTFAAQLCLRSCWVLAGCLLGACWLASCVLGMPEE